MMTTYRSERQPGQVASMWSITMIGLTFLLNSQVSANELWSTMNVLNSTRFITDSNSNLVGLFCIASDRIKDEATVARYGRNLGTHEGSLQAR